MQDLLTYLLIGAAAGIILRMLGKVFRRRRGDADD